MIFLISVRQLARADPDLNRMGSDLLHYFAPSEE
jgi:hypothetical protein